MGTQWLHKQKRSGKQRIYAIANATWTITNWIWTTIIIGFTLQFVPSYLLYSEDHNNKTPWTYIVAWFTHNVKYYPWIDTLPWKVLWVLSISAIPLLASITILAWVLKRSLREESEGLDKLIEILEHDTITPQLEVLQRQFQQLLQAQAASVKVLSRIDYQLQQMPTTTYLKDLQALAYRQEPTWKKTIDQALQDIHTRTIEQAGWLGDLYQQSQHTEETISANLHAIASILEQLRGKVEVAPLPQHTVSEAKSDQIAMAESFGGVTTPLPLDQLNPSNGEPTDHQFRNS
jgi:hypothetical protein